MKKSRFRLVSILIALSLGALICLQGWWLWDMYGRMNEQFARRVQSAMDRAAYEELLAGRSERALTPVSASFISLGNIDSISVNAIEGVEVTDSKASIRGKVITLNLKADTLNTHFTIGDADGPTRRIVQSFYYNRGPVLRFDLKRYDSTLTALLAQRDIALPHRVEIVGDSLATAPEEHAPTQDEAARSEAAIGTGPEVLRPLHFVTHLDPVNGLRLRLSIENPNRSFLGEMAVVILSSLLILLLVAFSFLYLLRTLFRQKSIEQMRRDFTHNITHELKTPIAIAYAATDALAHFGAGDDAARREKYLGVIGDQLTSLSQMVERILRLSLEEREELRIERESCRVRELLEEVAAQYRLQAGKQALITVEVTPEELIVRADRFHLAHVLGNLVDNSLKYSGQKVAVHLSARRVGSSIRIDVRDDGNGIPRSAQEHLFEKFYRVPTGDRHEVKGFGLGLYYTHLIVAAHSGTIEVESAPGAGSCFTITLPDDER